MSIKRVLKIFFSFERKGSGGTLKKKKKKKEMLRHTKVLQAY